MEELYDDQPKNARWLMALVIIGIVAVLGFVAWDQRPWAASEGSASDLGMLASDSPRRDGDAPNFALLDEDGQLVRLSDFEGKPVFLNFWATWCTFCKEEMPDMQRVQDQYGDELVVIGVNAGDSVEDGEAFAQRAGISYLRLYDSDLAVTEGYLVRAMPTSYFITAEGTISDANFGFMVYDQMIEEVEKAMSG